MYVRTHGPIIDVVYIATRGHLWYNPEPKHLDKNRLVNATIDSSEIWGNEEHLRCCFLPQPAMCSF